MSKNIFWEIIWHQKCMNAKLKFSLCKQNNKKFFKLISLLKINHSKLILVVLLWLNKLFSKNWKINLNFKTNLRLIQLEIFYLKFNKEKIMLRQLEIIKETIKLKYKN